MANEHGKPGGIALIQDFVNTLELEHGPDRLESPEEAAAWFSEHGFRCRVPMQSALKELRALREAIRGVLLANNGGAEMGPAWETLRERAKGAIVTFDFFEPGSARLISGEESPGGEVAAAIVAAVYDAVRDGTWRRLKACRKDSCLWAFYDQSKNGSGAWCSMATCGNRVKAQRRRQRSSASGR